MTVSALGAPFAAPRAGELSRSWLLVNARYPGVFSDAAASGADEVVLDVEDAVNPRCKESARDGVVTWLAAGGSAWVRVNARSTDFWDDDMRALRASDGLRGVVLAKAEHASEGLETVDALRETCPSCRWSSRRSGSSAPSRLLRRREHCVSRSGEGTTSATPEPRTPTPPSRFHTCLVVATRASGLPGPIDGRTLTDDETVLSQEPRLAADLSPRPGVEDPRPRAEFPHRDRSVTNPVPLNGVSGSKHGDSRVRPPRGRVPRRPDPDHPRIDGRQPRSSLSERAAPARPNRALTHARTLPHTKENAT